MKEGNMKTLEGTCDLCDKGFPIKISKLKTFPPVVVHRVYVEPAGLTEAGIFHPGCKDPDRYTKINGRFIKEYI